MKKQWDAWDKWDSMLKKAVKSMLLAFKKMAH